MLLPPKSNRYRVRYEIIDGTPNRKGTTYTRYWGKVENGLRVGSVYTHCLMGGRTESHKVIEFSVLGRGES